MHRRKLRIYEFLSKKLVLLLAIIIDRKISKHFKINTYKLAKTQAETE